jgi:hypothetical protein
MSSSSRGVATVRLQAWRANGIDDAARWLSNRLNGPREATVDISVEDDVISITADTWEPILRVRVEDALDAELGWLWRDHFVWAP